MIERFRIFQDQIKPHRPKIPFKLGNRVSRNVRQQQLDRLIDETIILYTDKEEAYNRAVEEETVAHKMSLWEIQLENSSDLFTYWQLEVKYHDYIANCIWSIQLDIQGTKFILNSGTKHQRQQQHISFDWFVQTIPKPPPLDGIHGVLALDCDMCNDFENSSTTKNEMLPVTSSNINMDHRNKAEDEFRQEMNIIWKKPLNRRKHHLLLSKKSLFGSNLLFSNLLSTHQFTLSPSTLLMITTVWHVTFGRKKRFWYFSFCSTFRQTSRHMNSRDVTLLSESISTVLC
jgi:hypothetical protein